MASRVAVDERLLNKAQRLGRFRTRKETVTAALEELIARRGQRQVLAAMGTIAFRPDWDYKKDRREGRR